MYIIQHHVSSQIPFLCCFSHCELHLCLSYFGLFNHFNSTFSEFLWRHWH